MSLGLAISNVAKYTAWHADALQEVDSLELRVRDLANNKTDKDDPIYREALAELTKWKTLAGLYKDFLTFWQDMIKSIMEMIRKASELAVGTR